MVSKQKILIVDDDNNIAELISLYLTKECFDTMIVNDGESVMPAMETFAPNLILLDLMLPGKDGFEICREYREKFLAPVIMVSAKKEDIDKIHGLGMGADDYMTKPFSPSELVARVKAHLNRYDALTEAAAGPQEENEVIVAGDLKIDRTARRVFIRGVEKTFTTKEFDLLFFLAKNPNHVFSKEELFQEIWGTPSVGDIATVTVHIKKLREKIEEDTSNPEYIETIWGVGYRFRA